MAASSFKVESGIQLIARLTKKLTNIKFYPHLFPSGLKPGEVIELIHNEDMPICLITDIICTALLPTNLGGAESGVLIFNCSGNFNFSKLVTSMRQKIKSYTKTLDEMEVDDLIAKQFNNLFVVDIHDATQFYTTIYNLENVLLEHTNITMVMFDNIAAFYWSEQGFKIMKIDTYLKKVLSKIQNVTKEHKVIVLYSKPHYFNSSKDAMDSLEACYELPSLDGVNYRISVSYDRDSIYLANVKSYNMQQQEKRFCINEEQLTWI